MRHMETVRVPGFAPSVHGLRFANSFTSAPIRRFQLGAFATLTVGDVANGLCGGMTFVAAVIAAEGVWLGVHIATEGLVRLLP